jgi:DNA-binding transcriptional regulator YdaS (Cro superfamily)
MSGSVSKTPKQALLDAIEFFGSQAKLAKAIGIQQPSIAGALLRGQVSEAVAIAIDRASGGKVPKHRLRPDLFKRGSR